MLHHRSIFYFLRVCTLVLKLLSPALYIKPYQPSALYALPPSFQSSGGTSCVSCQVLEFAWQAIFIISAK
ncbi:hypothetical protein DNTS_014875 [Danionella cerebrum]|uniref:Uncharacterized protein n=1 Tax=Danionella cerebrum TaxID=2873325 RepID=A0A553RCA7_9TELE|nr:hypothetical protein DNTS_014875 [Danionella translucida]